MLKTREDALKTINHITKIEKEKMQEIILLRQAFARNYFYLQVENFVKNHLLALQCLLATILMSVYVITKP